MSTDIPASEPAWVSITQKRIPQGSMTIGAGIFLIAVGAILKFATNWHVAHVNIDTVGIILMIAGVAGLILGFIQQGMASRRTRAVEYRGPEDPPPPRY